MYADELSNLDGLKKGDPISVGTLEGTIEHVNDELNVARARALMIGGVAVLAFVAVGGWTAVLPGLMAYAETATTLGSLSLGAVTGSAAAAATVWAETKSAAALALSEKIAPHARNDLLKVDEAGTEPPQQPLQQPRTVFAAHQRANCWATGTRGFLGARERIFTISWRAPAAKPAAAGAPRCGCTAPA